MPRVIGIDLGTTCSAVAVMEAGRPVVLRNGQGSRNTPSVVAFTRDGEVLVGEEARRQAVTNPDRTIFSVKRHMGSGWRVDVSGRSYTAPEISAHILAKLKRDAEAQLGEPVTQAVITVPASFSEPQRIATKLAGEMAGLQVLRLVNESSATAIAHGFDQAGDVDEPDRTVLVLHLGGGTFGVSVVEMGDGVFEVKATRGDAQLGGDDWDRRVVDWLVSRFWSTHGVDLSTDPVAAQRLHEAAERAKTGLSQAHQARVELPFISAAGTAGQRPLDLDETVSRAGFLELTAHLLDRCRGSVEGVFGDADIRPDQIDDVILVGDATRMPAVDGLVRDLTGREPLHRAKEVVAAGAAIQAGVLTGDVMDVLLLDVVPLSLGIEAEGGVMIRVIERNTTIPERCTMIFTTAEDNQTSVDINVFQGEAEQARHNTPLGRFQLVGLPPARRGGPEIEVNFDIDANGILHVSAKDRATNQEQSIVATG